MVEPVSKNASTSTPKCSFHGCRAGASGRRAQSHPTPKPVAFVEVVTGDAVVLRRTDVLCVGAVARSSYHHNIHRLHPRSDAVGDRRSLTQFDLVPAPLTAFLITSHGAVAPVGYPLVWETVTRGPTSGKIVMGPRGWRQRLTGPSTRQALFAR